MKTLFLILVVISSLLSQSNDSITIGTFYTPPYHVSAEQGYCTELVQEVLTWIEAPYSFVPTRSFPVVRKVLSTRRFDAVLTYPLSMNDSTIGNYQISAPLLESSLYLCGIDSSKLVNDYKDLRGKRVALLQGFPYRDTVLQQLGQSCIVTVVENDSIALEKLQSGSVDYITLSTESMRYFNSNQQTSLVRLFNEPMSLFKLCLVFNNETIDSSLVKAFSETLQEVKSSEFGDVLREKWQIK